ncbi:MAG TPA: peroxiredoxin [Candidatus Paceibacterota bacterium]
MSPKGQKSNYCEYCGDFHDSLHEYSTSIRVGEVIPDYEFEAHQDAETKVIKFSDYRGSWLVLMFYPADFSSVCSTELEDIASLYDDFKKYGAEVISMSTDTVFAHKAWRDSREAFKAVTFPMGADPSGKIASAFGILVEGDDLPYLASEGLALRGTFVIDPKGILRTMEVHDTGIGRSAKETLRKMRAAQFLDANPGGVCPAGWEPE